MGTTKYKYVYHWIGSYFNVAGFWNFLSYPWNGLFYRLDLRNFIDLYRIYELFYSPIDSYLELIKF